MSLVTLSCSVFVGSLCCIATTAFTAHAQTAPTLDQIRQAYAPAQHPVTVMLSGTFVSTDGSTTQNGNTQLIVGSDGSYTASTIRTIGINVEQRQVGPATGSACLWQDAAGTQHDVDAGNCVVPAWFFPELQVLSPASTSEWVVNSAAPSGIPHLLCTYSSAALPTATQPPTMDIALSPDTLLPENASFTLHPDGHSNVDVPVVISCKDYRLINGVMVPFRIQKTLNGTLVLDLTITSATVN